MPKLPILSTERTTADNNDADQLKTAMKKDSTRAGYSNVATISSVRSAEPQGDDKGQAYYAGGSEHSGQQGNILSYEINS